ncbi:MAG: site-2 protease family protein [Candidatus Omnitrophica bacterium]|nr:site-2 protease family protein [Candidatus Omnitrophota bacterium]
MEMILIWFVLLLSFFGLGYLLATRRRVSQAEAAPPPGPSPETMASIEQRVSSVLRVAGHKSYGDMVQFEGVLRTSSTEAMSQLKSAFQPDHLTPLLQQGDGDEVRVLLLPARAEWSEPEKPKWWLHGLLVALTLVTTTWAGALHAGVNLLEQPGQFTIGLPYALALMLILGAHELGHYITARRYGIRVTPPFFIPVPFALGTFGAFIKIKSVSPTRRAVFDVAVAGPLAGLVFAIPALLIGIGNSKVVPVESTVGGMHVGLHLGSSFMMAMLAKLALGPAVTEGHRLLLDPMAFAGWLGLLVTALNLLPIGQLDGGHMTHALFGGRRGHSISVAGLVMLFALALFVWPGLMLWAFVVWFIAGTYDMPPANDLMPLNASRRALGYCMYLLLAMILVPVPPELYRVVGLGSPYL